MDFNVTEIIEKGNPIIEPLKQLSEFIKDKVANVGMTFSGFFATVFILFIGAGLIWLATKITNKLAKAIMIISGIILLIGILLNILT